MSWIVIPVEGPERVFHSRASISRVHLELKPASGCDVVNLRDGRVMMVDDTGLIDGKSINERATKIYHSLCKPGTVHPICGDVAIVNDSDFSSP